MKYALPVSGGVLCPHFGHCEQFAMIDVDEVKREIIKKELVTAPGASTRPSASMVSPTGSKMCNCGWYGHECSKPFQ